ncbi:MAG: hypothetical protein V1695_01170, partial [Candidatus Uhrbacteria bacterium]
GNGTIAVVGKYSSNDDPNTVVLVADPQMIVSGPRKIRFKEVFSGRNIISKLYFPEGSSNPAFLAHGQDSTKAEFSDDWVWNLDDEQVRLPAPKNVPHENRRPLFWVQSGVACGAIIAHSTLYESVAEHPYKVKPIDLDLPKDYLPVSISLIGGRLLSKWNSPTIISDLRRHRRSRLVWNDQTTPELRIFPDSITEGPDGQPHFLLAQQPSGDICLGNMHGYVTALDHRPQKIWTAPGKIYTEEVVSSADITQGKTIRIHEVISGWTSTTIGGAPNVREVWPVGDRGKSIAVLTDEGQQLRYLSEDSVEGGFADLGQCGTRLIGNIFAYQFDDVFSFCRNGNFIFDATGVPRQKLSLKDLVLMDDGSIQGVAKIGTAVITYKFYDPSV